MNTRMNSSGTTHGLVAFIGTLIVLAAIIFPVSALQMNGPDVSATATGETVYYPITFDEAPKGLAGFDITVQLDNPSVGDITNVTFPVWATMNKSGALPADTVTVKAVDLINSVKAGSTGITLATLTLRADQAGTTPVTITIKRLDNDNGDVISPAIQAGSFTVAGKPVIAPVADFSADPTCGMAPLSVHFTDLSTGDGISAWAWDFNNDGVIDSTEQNPVHIYTAAGTFTVSLNTTNSGGSDTMKKAGYITGTSPASVSSKVGVFRPTTHTFYLKNGTKTTALLWGLSTDLPVTGDWNGDVLTDVGVFRPTTHTFYLKNGTKTTALLWGLSTDLPVTGDWNGDGLTDVGVFRPTTHTFYLKNGTKTTALLWGLSTDLPVTGDWNGDGLTDVGVFRPTTHMFYLKNGSVTTVVNWGQGTDLPVTGDWNGDSMADVGVFQSSIHTFLLKNGSSTTKVNWGTVTDLPVTGVWS